MQLKLQKTKFNDWLLHKDGRYLLFVYMSIGVVASTVIALTVKDHNTRLEIIAGMTILFCLWCALRMHKGVTIDHHERVRAKHFLATTHSHIFGSKHSTRNDTVNDKLHDKYFDHALKILTVLVRRLKNYWLSLAALYILMLASGIFLDNAPARYNSKHIKDGFFLIQFTLNNLSAFYLVECFLELYPFRSTITSDHSLQKVSWKKQSVTNYTLFFIFGLTVCYFLALLAGIQITEHDCPTKTKAPLAIICEAQLAGTLKSIHSGFFLLSGLINAIAFALLIGRLDNKFFGLENIVIAFLFLYPALQPLFFEFKSESSFKITVIVLALLCKIYFYFLIRYLVETGRMLPYFYGFSELEKRVSVVYGNQFEIIMHEEDHGEVSTFEITNKNINVFSTRKTFKKIQSCVEFIKSFRAAIADERLKFHSHHEFGTHWMEISMNDDVIGHSQEFRTTLELESFIGEFRQYVPYCKVSFG